MPQLISSWARAYSTMKIAGQLVPIGSQLGCGRLDARRARRAAAGAGRCRARLEQPRGRRRRAWRRPARWRSRSAAMPGYCAPPPGNMKAMRPLGGGCRVGEHPAGVAALEQRDGLVAVAHREHPALGEVAAPDLERPRDVGEVEVGVRRGGGRRGGRRWPSRASRLRAESASRRQRVGARSTAARSGASSSTAKALVPPTPSELTPARRGRRPSRRQSASSSLTKNGLSLELDVAGCSPRSSGSAGARRWRRASATLIRLATPAAVSRWPMLVLTLPMRQNPVLSVRCGTPG